MNEQPDTRDSRTFAIIGAAMEVHRILGPGFLEQVYKDALCIEMTIRQIPFMTEAPLPVTYKGHRLSGHYRADFLCYDSVVVEIKAGGGKNPAGEQAQMLNYLKASGMEHGLLLDFGGPRLTFRRFVMSKEWEREAQPVEPD